MNQFSPSMMGNCQLNPEFRPTNPPFVSHLFAVHCPEDRNKSIIFAKFQINRAEIKNCIKIWNNFNFYRSSQIFRFMPFIH